MITDSERRARLAHRHRLTPARRTDDVDEITNDLIAVHSSDPATVFLSVAARMVNPAIDALERALYERRSQVRHHAMRRTLWVMARDVAAMAHASSGRKVAATERRTLLKRLDESLGDTDTFDAEQWLDDALEQMTSLVASQGPVMTRELGEQLPHLRQTLAYPAARGETVDIAAHTKVIQLAGFEGRVVRTRPQGTWIGSQYAWSPMADWIPEGVDQLDTHDAQTQLIDRWLKSFGPGTDVDLAWWTGWTKTDVKRALAAAEAERVELESGEPAWVCAEDRNNSEDQTAASDPGPWAALLPGLDSTSMGWKERGWYLDDAAATRVIDRNGNIGPTVWVDGEIVGGWVQRPDGSLPIELHRPVSEAQRALIDDEIDRLRELIGDIRFRVRFPSPNQRDLLAD